MAEHYTDEDVQAAAKVMLTSHAQRLGYLPGPAVVTRAEQYARDALDAVAPAIAARREAQVLREASERYAKFPRPDSGLIPKEWADGFMEALDGVADDLRRRADEIEGR